MEEQDLSIDLDTSLSICHFQNTSKTTGGRQFSYAVDCFLEISYRLFLPEIKARLSIKELSEFFYLLSLSGSMEILSNPFDDVKCNAFRLLDEIREPTWSKIKNCGTFANRNSNAEFSEIFSSNIFEKLSEGEKNLFEISCEFKGTCCVCDSEKHRKSSRNVVLISDVFYPELICDPNTWSDVVTDLKIPMEKFTVIRV